MPKKIKDCAQPSQEKPLEVVNRELLPFPNYICSLCERYAKCFPKKLQEKWSYKRKKAIK